MPELSKAGPYEDVARALARTPFSSIAYVEETASTNADAAALLDDERFGGHTIVAEYQSRGAGRKGRTWLATAGTALLFTTILPRPVDTEHLWIVPYWVALAVGDALLDFGIASMLQWPNDLLIGDRKIAGILCQSAVMGSSARVACGVGINVRRSLAGPPIEPSPAFCSDVAAVDRSALLQAILKHYNRALASLAQPERVRAQWDAAAGLPGRRYRIAPDEGGEFEGTAEGLAAGGGLRVVRDDGAIVVVGLADSRVLR